MEAAENAAHRDVSGTACGDVGGAGVPPGDSGPTGGEDQPTAEQWQAALQELCKTAQASGQQQAYFANPIGGTQGCGLWPTQPLLAAYGAIPFFGGVFPAGYSLPASSAPPSTTQPKEEDGEEPGEAASEALTPARPSKRAKTHGGMRHQENTKTGADFGGPLKSASQRTCPTTSKPSARMALSTVAPGKGGLSIDALAAAARAAVRSQGTSSDFWHSPDCGIDLQKVAFLDDKELKRQRRKQSNRESARRSRLRKQQECENLNAQVRELIEENSDLKRQLHELQEMVDLLRQEARKDEPVEVSGEHKVE